MGKDKTVKYWDADKFEPLLQLDGHHGQVWCLAVSSGGEFLVTGGADRSLRRWERTEARADPFFCHGPPPQPGASARASAHQPPASSLGEHLRSRA